jgi:hypothetical protein
MSVQNKTENKFRWRPRSVFNETEEKKSKLRSYKLNLKIKKQPEDIDLVFKKYNTMIVDNNKLKNIAEVYTT